MAHTKVLRLVLALLILVQLFFLIRLAFKKGESKSSTSKKDSIPDQYWRGPDSSQIPTNTEEGELILYGRNLIAKTAEYIGPAGKISHGGNGMNCQNCHLDAGTKAWGNNYGGVYSSYPRYRPRRGSLETIPQRINDCFSRSLNGAPLDSNGKEMKAILAYIKWLGNAVPKGTKPPGSGIMPLKFLNRPADSTKGRRAYLDKCQRCHGKDGQGNFFPGTVTYQYPPLWGLHSYNTAAGLYRLSSFAGYVKNNMPDKTNYKSPQITDEEAWDLAAFVNSQPRPEKKFREDWPNIAEKPIDHPFGPFADSFSERQHKYGPFDPIKKAKDELDKKKLSKLN